MILEKIKIQDQMTIIGVKCTAFVIGTNKGILIVPVEFYPVIKNLEEAATFICRSFST